MTLQFRSFWSSRLGLAAALVVVPALLLAADRHRVPKPGEYNPDSATVEMFSAIEKGQIDVKLIPKDSTQCKVMIENKTDKPLNVKLPSAFAGVPVLAQVAGGGAAANTQNQNQGTGGGMGGGGMGGGGMGGGGGGGFFNVAPEKVAQFKVATICLEHGKAEPKPAVKYEIRPIESFTDKPAVQELCRMVGTGQLNQRAAQVAAWNLNNNMSWQQLIAKRLQFANGTSAPYFTPQEVQAGMQIAVMAVNIAEKRQQESSSSSGSLSQNGPAK